VPESTPLAALSARPDGNVPDATLQTYGCTPLLAVRLAWNWTPTWAFGSALFVICNGVTGTPAPVTVTVAICVVTTGAIGTLAVLARGVFD